MQQRTLIIAFIALIVLGIVGYLLYTPAQQGVAPGLAPVRDIKESVEIKHDGEMKIANVRMQKWILHDHMQIEALDLPGFNGVRVLQLAAGEITTVIRSERTEREEGSWWTVPAGEPLGLVTGNESAILWAIAVDSN